MTPIQWSDWMPKPAPAWETQGPVLLSGAPSETALLAEDMARGLPAKIAELKLAEKFGEPDAPDEFPPSWDAFTEQFSDDDTHVIVPRFIPPASLEQSQRLLDTLGNFPQTFILCVEPSQRRPVAGPRIWTDRASVILTIRGGVLRDARTGASVELSRPKTCPEVLRELLASGPVPYEVARRKILERFAEKTFWHAVGQVARKELYLVSDGVPGVDSRTAISDEGSGVNLEK